MSPRPSSSGGLRKPLRLRLPIRAEFRIRQGWLRNPEMMSYNAGWALAHPGYDNDTGCIEWCEPEWDTFGARILLPAEQQGYFFVEDAAGTPVGHAHAWVANNVAEIGFNIVPNHRGPGVGHAALPLLLDHIWANTHVNAATNELEEARAAASTTHLRAGFSRACAGGTEAKPTTLRRLDRPNPS